MVTFLHPKIQVWVLTSPNNQHLGMVMFLPLKHSGMDPHHHKWSTFRQGTFLPLKDLGMGPTTTSNQHLGMVTFLHLKHSGVGANHAQ